MIVLISGISFLGYVLFKLLGTRRGTTSHRPAWRSGIQHCNNIEFFSAQPQKYQSCQAIRNGHHDRLDRDVWQGSLRGLGCQSGRSWPVVWAPVALAGLAGLFYAAYLYLAPHGDDEEDVQITNPFELRPAITFGLLYGLILLVARAAQMYLGDTGVFISAFISGLADVDAITLSVAELSGNGDIALQTAARAIVIAVMANTLVKGGHRLYQRFQIHPARAAARFRPDSGHRDQLSSCFYDTRTCHPESPPKNPLAEDRTLPADSQTPAKRRRHLFIDSGNTCCIPW